MLLSGIIAALTSLLIPIIILLLLLPNACYVVEQQHAVINATGAHTLRFLPPLVCEEADVDSLIEILSDVLG